MKLLLSYPSVTILVLIRRTFISLVDLPFLKPNWSSKSWLRLSSKQSVKNSFFNFLRVGHILDKPVVDNVRRIVIFHFIDKCLRSVDFLDGSCKWFGRALLKDKRQLYRSCRALSSRLDNLGLRRSRTHPIK